MSDFDKDFDKFPTATTKTANFDDFERLDDFPIHEQPEAEERETRSAAAATSSLADFDDMNFMQNFGIKSQEPQPHEGQFGLGGLHSTDRPLMTAEEPLVTPVPESSEIHLTPDPEEYKAEPFINITARNVGDIPTNQMFGLDPDDEFDPVPTRPSAPEPSLFDPYAYHAHDEEDKIGHDQGDDLLNFQRSSYKLEEEELEEEKRESSTFARRSFTEEINILDKTPKTELSEPIIIPAAAESKSFVEDIKNFSDLQPTIAVSPPKMEATEVKSVVEEEINDDEERKCLFHPRAWFNPSKIDPRVADLIYWRDVKKSGVVFGSGMVILLSLAYFSFISVVSYLLLGVMTGTLSYRIYKNVLQAVQKSGEGHPFKEYLDFDLSLPKEKVQDGAEVVIKHLECTARELRRLFLVEDLVDSLKFAVMLWCFTYIGAWFNGLTLFIMAFVSLFTLPKVYETYKTQIDFYLNIVCTHVSEIVNKVKAKLPVGKKPKQQ